MKSAPPITQFPSRVFFAFSLGLLIFILLASSCTLGPCIARTKSGSFYASTGVSLLTRSSGEFSELTLPDGTTMKHSVTDKDETRVPAMIGNDMMAGKTAGAIGAGIKAIR